MKKFSLTHKLLAVALAFVLVAVSLPDYLSFAQQPAQEQSETDEFEDSPADGDPSDDDLSGDNPSDTGEQEMEQQVFLHLQAPETVPMGTAGSFGLSAPKYSSNRCCCLYPADTGGDGGLPGCRTR